MATRTCEKFENLKVPRSLLARVRAIKERDRVITGRSTTMLDVVNIGIKHLEDEHRQFRENLLAKPNGVGHKTARRKRPKP